MERVEIGENTYELALGPRVLEEITRSYKNMIPEVVAKKVEEYAKRMDVPPMEFFVNEEKAQELVDAGILSVDDNFEMLSSKREHTFNMLKKCVRKMNGHRVLKHPHFEEQFDEDELKELTKEDKEDIFYDEVMPSKDYLKVQEEINKAIFEFKFGLSIEEKSKLLSQLKGEQKANMSEILQSESS